MTSASSRRGLLGPAIILILLCCLVAAGAGVAYYFLWTPAAEARPVVLIRAPEDGEQVLVGRPVLVHAVARDETRISRAEIWINGELHGAQESALPDGTSPFPLVVYWEPASAGTHTLTARAFSTGGARAEASITVEAVTEAEGDADGDDIADAFDACPDEPGWASAAGCPDGDGDGIADADDACPDTAGLPEGGGCPVPSEGDRDGDGTPDDEDVCPDEPGMDSLDGCPMPTDSDGDEIPDDEDACPGDPGGPETDGCPDGDGDGFPDGEDGCPEEPGPPGSDGCPTPADGDRDGDGFPDGEDECPDEAGVESTWGCPDRDGDGVRDSADECPDEPGPPENRGCPVPGSGGDGDGDRDGDGTPDELDPCPDEWGPPEHDGCPDTDGDGIPDWWDICDDEPGPPETIGCPESGAGDRDGDGVPDDVDLCPDEAGEPEDGGCPPGGEGGDGDGDGIPDTEEGDSGFLPGPGEFYAPGPGEMPVAVEFQALRFEVDDEYDLATCYPTLAGGPRERYEFDPLGERQWDIAAELGSRTLLTTLSEPIEVRAECGAYWIYLGPEGGEGTYFDLGSVDMSHPSSDWDGHVITVRSSGGSDGRWFEADYRLCINSCEDASFPPPYPLLLSHGRDDLLIWQWDGNMRALSWYDVYMDGTRIARMEPGDTNVATMVVNDRAPSCGSRHEFHVVAVGWDGRRSLPSNSVFWEADPCPRVVRVTFDHINTFSLGDDEWWAHGNSVGPIWGNFWASGSTDERLEFNAVDYGEWAWERVRGFRLRHTHYYAIQDIFDQIWTWIAGSMSTPYRAPDRNYVTVELGPGDSLSFGGLIVDADTGNPSDTLFDGRRELSPDEVYPRTIRIWDRNIELTVLIDVIVGPEVGPRPDLTITNVEMYEGQLRIHVFNNASDMEAPTDLVVNLNRVNSGVLVASLDWSDVQIPSGGRRILVESEPPEEFGGLYYTIDPYAAIDEENEGNNVYETPVTMRVEFLRVHAPHCSESSCSIFDCDSEWKFGLYAGYGPSESDIAWVARNVRFPRSGELIACGHDVCMYKDSPDEDWVMEGDERYTFEFDMPAADRLFVEATATELDVWTSDDPFATDLYSYTARDNWGARPEEYWEGMHATRSCNDAFCFECREGNVSARWRITRVR